MKPHVRLWGAAIAAFGTTTCGSRRRCADHQPQRSLVWSSGKLGRPRRQPPRLRRHESSGRLLTIRQSQRLLRISMHAGSISECSWWSQVNSVARPKSAMLPARGQATPAPRPAPCSPVVIIGPQASPISGPAAASPRVASSVLLINGVKPAIDRVCGPGDFLATIYQHLGIDYAKTLIKDFNGRPTPIVDHGNAIPELIGLG